MNVISEQVPLYDNGRKTVVYASMIEGIDQELIADTAAKWKTERRKFASKRYALGLSMPEHSHWDWNAKAAQAMLHCDFQSVFSIEYGGEIQGLMLVDFAMHLAILPSQRGKPLLYIDYLESAPHNQYEEPRRFSGVGFNFYRVAIQYSIHKGCQGRIGLHALPQAESFYAEKCGMSSLGIDIRYQNLAYFESTPEQAESFIKKRQMIY